MTAYHSTQQGSEAGGRSAGQSEGGNEVIEGDWRREEVRTRRRGKEKSDTGKRNGTGEDERGSDTFRIQARNSFSFRVKNLHYSLMGGRM